jgi:hypothetical protein
MLPVSAKRNRKIRGAIIQVDTIVSDALLAVFSGEVVATAVERAADSARAARRARISSTRALARSYSNSRLDPIDAGRLPDRSDSTN